jgi:hypothetical protein
MTSDYPLYEHTELSWEGNLDELVFLMLIESCQCATSDDEDVAILDPKVTKIGISYRSHPSFKNVLQVLFLTNRSNI